jgi:deoxyribonuclease-4
MWRALPPDPAGVMRLKQARERLDLTPLVVHDNYLINLAATEPVIRQKSIAAFRGEIERAVVIGAEYLVAHPGSYRGQSLEEGMRNFIMALLEASRGLKGELMILLENTAGCGAQIGCRFEELAAIRAVAQEHMDLRLGYCLDTCHCLAAGYDVSTTAGLTATLNRADEVLGLTNVRIIHTNDSKTRLGSRVDRHEHIGRGHIGKEGFRRILNHPKLRDKAFILETPVDEPGDDRKNVEMLKKLCRKSSTTTKRSS